MVQLFRFFEASTETAELSGVNPSNFFEKLSSAALATPGDSCAAFSR